MEQETGKDAFSELGSAVGDQDEEDNLAGGSVLVANLVIARHEMARNDSRTVPNMIRMWMVEVYFQDFL